jgi:hypothetical protein
MRQALLAYAAQHTPSSAGNNYAAQHTPSSAGIRCAAYNYPLCAKLCYCSNALSPQLDAARQLQELNLYGAAELNLYEAAELNLYGAAELNLSQRYVYAMTMA